MLLKLATLAWAVGLGLMMAQPGAPGPSVPLACNMKAVSATERARYQVLIETIERAVRTQSELPSGFSWNLDGSKMTILEAAEWISLERRCCPFLNLQVEASGSGVDFKLNLQGPEGVKAFLKSEFASVGKR